MFLGSAFIELWDVYVCVCRQSAIYGNWALDACYVTIILKTLVIHAGIFFAINL